MADDRIETGACFCGAFEAMMGLEMGKTHFDLFALVA